MSDFAKAITGRPHQYIAQGEAQSVPAVHSCISEMDTAISALGGAVDALLARLAPVQREQKSDRPPGAVAIGRQPRGIPVADQIQEHTNRIDRYAERIREACAVLEV